MEGVLRDLQDSSGRGGGVRRDSCLVQVRWLRPAPYMLIGSSRLTSPSGLMLRLPCGGLESMALPLAGSCGLRVGCKLLTGLTPSERSGRSVDAAWLAWLAVETYQSVLRHVTQTSLFCDKSMDP